MLRSLRGASAAQFGTGADGDLVVSGSVDISGVTKNYNNLTIQPGGVLTAKNSRIFVRGVLNIQGQINADAGGTVGGPAVEPFNAGNAGTDLAVAADCAGGTGGGGGACGDESGYWASGGRGGNFSGSSTRSGGAGGASYGAWGSVGSDAPDCTSILRADPSKIVNGKGTGGGSGSCGGYSASGKGGSGGGYVQIFARVIISSGGVIYARGLNGDPGGIYTGPTRTSAGGGGGGGGIIHLCYRSKTGLITTSVVGGAGAFGTHHGGSSTSYAGNGGAGRVIEYTI